MGCCTGSTFTPAPDAALDPLQRVNYTFGMVLGVDDFRQEHAYLAARDERALRETIGYGVLTGLGVAAPAPGPGEGQQVRVAPGLALMPDGRLVGVAAEQCANLQTWLDAEKLRDPTTAANTTVYVLLRFAEASGSPVPIPGEPCRDESELSADARVVDSFALDFSWTPPDASEDLALRAVVAWIRGIKVRTTVPAGQTLQTFQALVEAGLTEAIKTAWGPDLHHPTAAQPADHVPPLPTPSQVSLPAPPKQLQIPRAEVAAYYAAAFDVWTRLLRSGVMAHHGPVPAAEPLAERALLLAAVDAKAAPDNTRAVRMLGRPQLLHLRLLQEWLLRDGSQDAPREAHYVLGKADPELDHAQDLLADFASNDHAMTRIDIVPDTTDGGSGNKAKVVPAVKWPGGGSGGGPDYYGPNMTQPIPVADGGTGQAAAPTTGALLVGRAASGSTPARFDLGSLVGATLPKPVGDSPNILVDLGNAPTIRLDTVQDIGPGASPTFDGLDLTGDLTVGGQLHVTGDVSFDGSLTLGEPLNSVLATDDGGTVVAARGWDGDEDALDAGKPPPYIYQPGQKAPVRIEDGGTGLQQRPHQLQMLVGVEAESASAEGGSYVLATLVGGKNTSVSLSQNSGEGGGDDWQLTIDAGAGAATQVVAAGGASVPASLTAVTANNVVTINTVQPLHTGATPRFQALQLAALPQRNTQSLVGWDASTGELVQTAAPQTGNADVGQWGIRYARTAAQLVVSNKDHVIVVMLASVTRLNVLDLPKLGGGDIDEGRVIVIKAATSSLGVTNVENGKQMTLETGNSLTVVAALKLDPPQWLVIGRS